VQKLAAAISKVHMGNFVDYHRSCLKGLRKNLVAEDV